tara:strand:- start:4464 stop:5357 length:894 start_codon:yes stop_codon:yes gene_type:complete
MSKYNTQKIEYPEYKTYLKNLQLLSNFDFTNYTNQQIYNKFHDLALTIPGLGAKLIHEKINGFELYRVRMENTISELEDKDIIQTFSFPPPAVLNSNGRANIKNKSVFYCTDHPYPAIKEANGGIGEVGFLGIWEIQASRDLVYLSCLPEVLPNMNNWHEFGEFHYNFLIEKQSDEDSKVLPHKIALRKLITDKFMLEKPQYHISSMIENEYLYDNDCDLLLYPSAQSFQDYINFAFHPNVVLSHLKCKKIVRFKINKITNQQVGFNLLGIGEIENDRIKWRKITDQDGLDLGFRKE